jgi:hypothetical protein
VQDGTFTCVSRRGEVQAGKVGLPPFLRRGLARVDLTGKTVMPGIIGVRAVRLTGCETVVVRGRQRPRSYGRTHGPVADRTCRRAPRNRRWTGLEAAARRDRPGITDCPSTLARPNGHRSSKPGAAGSSPAGRAIRLACRECANAGSLMASHIQARALSCVAARTDSVTNQRRFVLPR